jgi:hypothetical protein
MVRREKSVIVLMEPTGRIRAQVKFSATFEADLVSPPLDGEHAAYLPVTAPKDKSKTSSHSRRERALARAGAIEQSAAP